ncbi:retrovirus-related Pol polyprotein from transposon 297 [Trichonephila clavipes]|nr:retrovirus-related Pol polyprotein from transposon 297 [Trichonephila clavipes]
MAEPSQHTSRLFLLDRKSCQKFLIDSGSEICVIPPSPTMNKSPQSNFSLFLLLIIPKFQPMPSILTVDANISFKNILSEYPDLSNPSLISKSASHGTVHHIITTGPPVTARPRRLHPKLYDAVKVKFEFLLAQGIIRPSKSPWSSPLHVVPKSDSTVRPVGDYRQLNSVTETSFCFVYLDDILCYSENAEEHRSHIRTIFQRLSSYGLKLNISKCVFGVTELIFLGHLITPDGIKPLPDKVQTVLDYKQPETVGSLRKFLGLLNFYRRFLPKAAEQQYLLSEFLKGSKGKKDSKPLNWSSEAITAFQRCKQALADAALLAHLSPSAPLALHVDASDYAIGGALHQVVDSELQPLAFFSRKLTSSENSYSVYDRELLAIYSAIRHFRYMLEARDFTVFTDHKPL